MSNKIKLILVFILGVIISVSISVYASSIINSKDVLYDNTATNLSANVQGAIDETYTKANTLSSRITTLESNKQDKSWTEISVPKLSVTEDELSEYILYKIDLSKYTEVVPIIMVDGFASYSIRVYPIIAQNNFTEYLYYHSLYHGYLWEGSMSISDSGITLATSKKSTNYTSYHFSLKALYVR